MNLYLYSMWIYRVEKTPAASRGHAAKGSKPPVKHHIEIEFEESYASRHTFTQRLAVEPRVPMVEGMQFVSDKDPEAHCMLQAILFRPVFLPPPEDSSTKAERLTNAYKQLCTAPAGEETWPAQGTGPTNPGPFQRGWRRFKAGQEEAAERARWKLLRTRGVRSLWRCAEALRGTR